MLKIVGASLSKQQTADLLFCHGAGFVTKFSPEINTSITYVSHFSSQGS